MKNKLCLPIDFGRRYYTFMLFMLFIKSISAFEISSFPYDASALQITKDWVVTEGEMELHGEYLWLMGTATLDLDLFSLTCPVLEVIMKRNECNAIFTDAIQSNPEKVLLQVDPLSSGGICQDVSFTVFLPRQKVRLKMESVINLQHIRVFDAVATNKNYDWDDASKIEADWWMSGGCLSVENSGCRVSEGSLFSPVLNFSEMTNPEFRLKCSWVTGFGREPVQIKVSSDGASFETIGTISAHEASQEVVCGLPLNTRFVQIGIGRPESSLLLHDIKIANKKESGDWIDKITMFPFVTSFEPGQSLGWRWGTQSSVERYSLYDGDHCLNLHAGDTLFSTGIDLTGLKKPAFCLVSEMNGIKKHFMGKVLVSDDGIGYREIGFEYGSYSYLLPATTRFVALVDLQSQERLDYLIIGEYSRLSVAGSMGDLTPYVTSLPYSGLSWKQEGSVLSTALREGTPTLSPGESAMLHLPRYTGSDRLRLMLQVEGLNASDFELTFGDTQLAGGINELPDMGFSGIIKVRALRRGADPAGLKITRLNSTIEQASFPLIQHVYDADGDGVFDFFTRKTSGCDGDLLEQSHLNNGRLMTRSTFFIAGQKNGSSKREFRIEDINRDGRPDFISDDFGLCFATQESFDQIEAKTDLSVCDLNGDGIPDMVSLSDREESKQISDIRKSVPGLPVLMYTMHAEPWIVVQLVKKEVNGIVVKDDPLHEIQIAVKQILLSDTCLHLAKNR